MRYTPGVTFAQIVHVSAEPRKSKSDFLYTNISPNIPPIILYHFGEKNKQTNKNKKIPSFAQSLLREFALYNNLLKYIREINPGK